MSDNLQFQFANDAYYTADDGIYRQYNSTILAIDGVVIDVSEVRFFRFLGPRPQKTILSPIQYQYSEHSYFKLFDICSSVSFCFDTWFY